MQTVAISMYRRREQQYRHRALRFVVSRRNVFVTMKQQIRYGVWDKQINK